MFQEEMNKILDAEKESDRRRAECEARIKAMKENAEKDRASSFSDAKKKAFSIREECKLEAEKKANALKEKAVREAAISVEEIISDAEKFMRNAVALITEGVEGYGSR